MIKVLVIQPHSDDVLFSASHALFLPGYETQVLTIENDPKRADEDRRLYDFLQIPVHHLDLDFKDESYYHHFKTAGYKYVNSDNAVHTLNKAYGRAVLSDMEMEMTAWVKSFLRKNRDYRLFVPLGVGHPFHLFVQTILGRFPGTLYYRDFPHSYKRRSAQQISELKNLGFDLFKSYPVDEFHEVKWGLARKFYKSQSNILFYEQGYVNKRLPEEIWYFDRGLPFEQIL